VTSTETLSIQHSFDGTRPETLIQCRQKWWQSSQPAIDRRFGSSRSLQTPV